MVPFFASSDVTIFQADSRDAWKHLPEHSADAIVTSPPYFGLRDYGVDGQVGLEDNPQEYIDDLADLLTGYGTRVLKPGGSLWLNLGDTYNSSKKGSTNGTGGTLNEPAKAGQERATWQFHKREDRTWPTKSLLMIPERVALALIDRGWILRNRVVWAKPNGMPSSVRDRLATKHEALFHLVRQPRYHYDLDAIRTASLPTLRLRGSRGMNGRGAASRVATDSAACPSTSKACHPPRTLTASTLATCGRSRPSRTRKRTSRCSLPNWSAARSSPPSPKAAPSSTRSSAQELPPSWPASWDAKPSVSS